MYEKLSNLLTNKHQDVPLFYVTFDLLKYQEKGEKGSCDIRVHPSLADDEFIVEQLRNLIDHIRSNYNMENVVK